MVTDQQAQCILCVQLSHILLSIRDDPMEVHISAMLNLDLRQASVCVEVSEGGGVAHRYGNYD
jgi:hypothetical protein